MIFGGRLADHGLERIYAFPSSDEEDSAIFEVCEGYSVEHEEMEKFASFLMLQFRKLDVGKDWTNGATES